MTGLAVDITGFAGDFRVAGAFDVPRGVTALFGHSGSGKTSMLRMIAGLLKPQSGTIRSGERTLYDSASGENVAPHLRRVGYVFQDGRLFPHMNVRQNLSYAPDASKAGSDYDRIVGMLGIGHLLDRMAGSLSGGETQRVAIGRALLRRPDILLMDEPMSSLDHARRREIMPYLEAIRDEAALPAVFVSHEIDEVARLANRLVLLSQGQVVAQGDTQALFARPDLAPIIGRHEAGALIVAEVTSVDETYGLATASIGGSEVEIVASGVARGDVVRMRIRARDVAVSRAAVSGLSIRNQIVVTVVEVRREDSPFAELVLSAGDQAIIARITRKSLDELALKPGDRAVALLKAIALERRAIAVANPAEAGRQ